MPSGRGRGRVRGALTGLIASALCATGLRAQRVEAQLEGGLGRLSQDVQADSRFGYLGGSLRVSADRLTWTLLGSIAKEGDVDPAPFIATSLSYAATLAPVTRTEVHGGMGGTFGSDGRSRYGGLREFVQVGPTTLWLGGAIGDTRRAVTTSANTLLEGGMLVPFGGQLFTLEARQWRTADWPLVEAAGYFLTRQAKAYDLQDVAATLRMQPGPVELQFSAAMRRGAQATAGSSVGYGVTALIGLAREGALAIGAARQLADPLRGTPEGIVANIGVRWQWASGPLARPFRPATEPSVEALLERDEAGRAVLVLDVRAPAGARVEYATSVTDWTPVSIEPTAGRYLARIVLPSGNHRVAVRVNGGAWQSPAGLPRVDDDLGGEAALVIVPAREMH